jgi:hypothetical protein
MAPTRRGANGEPHRRVQRRRGNLDRASDEEDGRWRVELIGAALGVQRESVGSGVGCGGWRGCSRCPFIGSRRGEVSRGRAVAGGGFSLPLISWCKKGKGKSTRRSFDEGETKRS